MKKEILIKLIEEGLSQREMGKKLSLSQTSIRHWLSKFSLKTLDRKDRRRLKPHFCRLCGDKNPENFYGDDKEVCGKCHNERTKRLGKEKSKYAREKLGGKCIVCEYDKYQSALDIHHLNPKIKDKNFKSMRGWSIERIDREIKNCVLLCRNCHSAYHSNEMKEEEVEIIRGCSSDS